MERGISFEVVRIWPGDRTIERQLKQRGHAARFCPVCAGLLAWQRGRVNTADQFELPLDDFPEPPVFALDWYEIQKRRAWRTPRQPIDLSIFDEVI